MATDESNAESVMTTKQEERIKMNASELLIEASETIKNRASERDSDQERSMAKAVEMFNIWRGSERKMTESDGWAFMVFLKLSRASQGEYRRDDWIDGAAYMALTAESIEGAAIPEQDAEPVDNGGWSDWISWGGGECPKAARGRPVEVRYRDGQKYRYADGAAISGWKHAGFSNDIMAYRTRL